MRAYKRAFKPPRLKSQIEGIGSLRWRQLSAHIFSELKIISNTKKLLDFCRIFIDKFWCMKYNVMKQNKTIQNITK